VEVRGRPSDLKMCLYHQLSTSIAITQSFEIAGSESAFKILRTLTRALHCFLSSLSVALVPHRPEIMPKTVDYL
jgi:hypothetical protein